MESEYAYRRNLRGLGGHGIPNRAISSSSAPLSAKSWIRKKNPHVASRLKSFQAPHALSRLRTSWESPTCLAVACLKLIQALARHLAFFRHGLFNLAPLDDTPYADDIFEIAPNLRVAALTSWHPQPLLLPWKQLHSFTYRSADFPDLNRAQTTLGTVMGDMNCPHLRSLMFVGRVRSGPALRWNQRCFLEFASRSSLHATLIELRVDVMIEEHELLECLATLPLLEILIISDSENHYPTITDNLLQQLVWRPDQPGLVPRLDLLRLTSLLRFRDDALQDLVVSRMLPGRSDFVFYLEVHYLCGRERDLSQGFVEAISRLEDSGKGNVSFILGLTEE
ncbi:hypothetical protein DFH06DRAFT_582078 [Mycena polygramma]|nr:hypothetical protein DFH06DRAFT_582078 [Mycena polygramma]